MSFYSFCLAFRNHWDHRTNMVQYDWWCTYDECVVVLHEYDIYAMVCDKHYSMFDMIFYFISHMIYEL